MTSVVQFKDTDCICLQWTLATFKDISYTDTACFKYFIIFYLRQHKNRNYLTSFHSHWSRCSCIWVSISDMLSEVWAPLPPAPPLHGDTHHYHRGLPLPPCSSICLPVFVCGSMLPSADGAAVSLLTHKSGSGRK